LHRRHAQAPEQDERKSGDDKVLHARNNKRNENVIEFMRTTEGVTLSELSEVSLVPEGGHRAAGNEQSDMEGNGKRDNASEGNFGG